MADSRAAEVLEGYDRLKGARGTWENHWQEVAERVWPTMAEMTGWRTPGEKRSEKNVARVFNSDIIGEFFVDVLKRGRQGSCARGNCERQSDGMGRIWVGILTKN